MPSPTPVKCHTVSELVDIIGRSDATNCSDKIAAAGTILNNLLGYHNASSKVRARDTQELANALEAYAYLLQGHDVRVVL